MGTHGNGDNLPADGDRSPDEPVKLPELPDLPEGVIIPDDLASLADEAEQIRAEIDPDWQRPRPRPDHRSAPAGEEPALAMPLSLMSVAVVITLVSLFAMVWSGADTDPTTEAAPSLPAVVLTDASGQAVDVTAGGAVAIMLVESCDCAELIADTLAAAPPGVTVIAIGRSAPEPPPNVASGADLWLLADPDGDLRSALGLSRPYGNTATVVLANQHHVITRTVPAASTTASYEDALAVLTRG